MSRQLELRPIDAPVKGEALSASRLPLPLVALSAEDRRMPTIRRRILILGQTKENTYEIRNLLDSQRFELEIALNKDVGKTVLSTRLMHVVIVHSEIMGGDECADFFEFLEDKGFSIPVLILGEEAGSFRDQIPEGRPVACFEKPYPAEQILSHITDLCGGPVPEPTGEVGIGCDR